MHRKDFRALVNSEYCKQTRESDKEKHHYDWLGLVMEELGEAAQCVNRGRCPLDELVQVATLIEAWAENINVR